MEQFRATEFGTPHKRLNGKREATCRDKAALGSATLRCTLTFNSYLCLLFMFLTVTFNFIQMLQKQHCNNLVLVSEQSKQTTGLKMPLEYIINAKLVLGANFCYLAQFKHMTTDT